MKGTLHIVATPIGNTEDITERAKRILAEVDIVAAEDTRTTKHLLSALGIKNKTVSNHKFNEKRQVEFLIDELNSGKDIALVSDAGTPCISDPGGLIVKTAATHGIRIVGVCGASSVITALSVCGFFFGNFSFYGFLPKQANEIKKTLTLAESSTDVSVFFESPKRIKKTLQVFIETKPDIELCLCNDLTKKYERIYRGNPNEILDELNSNPSSEKGEYTLIANLGKNAMVAKSATNQDQNQTPEAMLIDHIVKNGGSVKEAVNALAAEHKGNTSKKDFYHAALNLRKLI